MRINTHAIAILVILIAPRLWASEANVDLPTFYRSPYSLERDGLYGRETRNTHERTHTVNAKLRDRYGGGCLFLMDGMFVRFKEPRLTIADVNRRVKWRGRDTADYLTGTPARTWNSTPLYLFDEWSAYTNGTRMAGRDGGIDYMGTLLHALEFSHYTATLVRMLPDSYSDRKEIRRFWVWNARRLDKFAERAKRTGFLYMQANDNWRAEMIRTIGEFGG